MANSETIVAVADNPAFIKRVEYFLVKAAIAVMNESEATVNHADRLIYASRALNSAVDFRPYALGVLANPTVAALADPATVTDNDLEFVVNSLFNAFAG